MQARALINTLAQSTERKRQRQRGESPLTANHLLSAFSEVGMLRGSTGVRGEWLGSIEHTLHSRSVLTVRHTLANTSNEDGGVKAQTTVSGTSLWHRLQGPPPFSPVFIRRKTQENGARRLNSSFTVNCLAFTPHLFFLPAPNSK